MKKYTLADYNDTKEMSTEEVIDNLLYIKRGYIGNYNFTGDEIDFERYTMHMTINNAVELIRTLLDKEQTNEQNKN